MRFGGERFGARLGIGLSLLGFVLIFLGWNGAASVNSLSAQFPYLISGGLGGLGLVIIGAALIIVESGRDDRERLQRELAELKESMQEAAAPARKSAEAPTTRRGAFIAGETTYHLPSCRLLEGREGLESVTREEAAKRRLAPCRVCRPEGTPSRPRARRR